MGFSNFFIFLLLIAFSSYLMKPSCGNAEIRAIMDIRASLDPENKYLSSWVSDGDPCSGKFDGVACNEHRKVVNISLQSKGLTGKVSPAVAELKCLSGLYLHYNSLTGEIPKEIANLTELTDLYLNVNNLSGIIPPEIGSMARLQVLQLCCNQFTGSIPKEMGFLKKLSVLTLQYNRLTGQIPESLGNLGGLRRLYLSFNRLSGPIPVRLANVPQLEVLDVQNNTLSGVVPSALRKLNGGFHPENNPGLCGVGFSSLRVCTAWDNLNINQIEPNVPSTTVPQNIPPSASSPISCNQTHCSRSTSKLLQMGIVAGVIIAVIALMVGGFLVVYRYRKRKQKIGNTSDTSDDRLSIDQAKEVHKKSPSSLVNLESSNGWDPAMTSQDCNGLCHEFLNAIKFNLEEVESATQHFSEVNLLGKSNFSAVYKGILKDGSRVAIKSISKINCKTVEAEFIKGLSLLTSLKHDNLVKLRGFCCSKARGECFLVYDFASNGNLSQYLDNEDDRIDVLDWTTRVSIISGIAKGIEYLHSDEPNKPPTVHQNISVEKVLVDEQFNPLILDSGLLKLLADDVVYSALKVSAAFGYMAPEYITTGRFTEKSDVYAFGVIILQVVSGKRKLASLTRLAAEAGKLEDFVDLKLKGKFSESEAARLAKIALDCTHELPDSRPTMASVVQELSKPGDVI
ncbi:LRR receptor-like serine threonine- kinase GSO1 [Olea europaea subsp. europaea]|uniref:LRR receptor-like serine threonine- kinase GSO1 n=1 Tax=Olea europaea subsp. europaea TaxID=158383 RepID=A0A8S0SAV1_OLEEU|nr:LRR receptor-like serine threonine- kinase GSO1 [Olea europaea subsp. europaea]